MNVNNSNNPSLRELGEDESDSLAAHIGYFYSYTQALKDDPNSQSDYLPETLTPDMAVAHIENTFNYHFARIDNELMIKARDTFSFEVSLDGNGEISTKTIALGFNAARTHIKDFYDNLNEDDKKLTLVDVEYDSEQGKINVYSDVSYFTTLFNISTYSTFGADDNWHIFDSWWYKTYNVSLGFIDNLGTYHPKPYGAPEVLRQYVLANLGKLYQAVNWYPINIQYHSVPVGGVDVTTTSLPTNPAAYYHNTTLLKTKHPDYENYYNTFTSNPNPADFIPCAEMNYFRQYGIPYHIQQAESNSSKTLIDFEIVATYVTNMTVNRFHRFNLLYTADKALAPGNFYNL